MSYLVNRRMEHKGRYYELEDSVSAGEAKLRKRIRCHRCKYKVSESTAYCNKYGIEYVSREGHPRVTHQGEQVDKVVERRTHYIEARREHEELIQGLQGLNNYVVHGNKHYDTEDGEHKGYAGVATRRTVKDNLVTSGS